MQPPTMWELMMWVGTVLGVTAVIVLRHFFASPLFKKEKCPRRRPRKRRRSPARKPRPRPRSPPPKKKKKK